MKPLSEVAPGFWSFRSRSKQCAQFQKAHSYPKAPLVKSKLYIWITIAIKMAKSLWLCFFLSFFSEQHAYCYYVFNDDQCICYWLSGSEEIPNFRSSLHSGRLDCLVFGSQICNLDFGKVFDGIRSWNYISCHYTVFEWNFFGMFFGYVVKKVLL